MIMKEGTYFSISKPLLSMQSVRHPLTEKLTRGQARDITAGIEPSPTLPLPNLPIA